MNRLKYIVVAVVIGGLLMGSTASLADDGPAKTTPNKVAGKYERHPHLRKALHELREARKELKTAAHDFGGHRVEAIEAIDVAIKQLEVALKYDKK
jgi:hypothetical protein